jgi:hypothetical protein
MRITTYAVNGLIVLVTVLTVAVAYGQYQPRAKYPQCTVTYPSGHSIQAPCPIRFN